MNILHLYPADNPLITHVATEAEIPPLIRGHIPAAARALNHPAQVPVTVAALRKHKGHIHILPVVE